MGRLERGQDALGLAQQVKRGQGFLVADPPVLDPPFVVEQRVLRAHRRVVEAGGDRVSGQDVARLVLQEIGPGPLEHAHPRPRAGQRARRSTPLLKTTQGH